MTLRITDWSITSDLTPEIAIYDPRGNGWTLSWLPGRFLTKVQAMSGMALDEFLGDFDLATAAAGDTPTEDVLLAFELAAARAEHLGITLEEAVVRLSTQIVQRDRRHHATGSRSILPAERRGPGGQDGACRSVDAPTMRPAGEGVAV
ncbi:hypothetical protein IU501_11920 [Nocardia otitidiscaviarum]|uniref:Uncharacterized protein n=1 Tax=Nocardia otitidiscaviarum TaxID=1823 RepID=A0A516NRZ6_9NOCA|nr:hypothetical protein [Nocardia otitidiscaviarum]MBF6133704.1 hypothetical protein [Nocardia otitidiscaviarum]MBF6179732.1 hypothetical protein [Nocardia otitidiscaviarum]MBF6235666.1 hypothetical protein [Nocardia otitidiscaviarum]MBF6487732.1 hypothetical protein [Nocardia otitidiscaviarum]MCP9620898.1 hypothetical protein [Nocardia otitidiscaviarum]